MNVIDYITITCNLKNVRLQITFDYMKNVIDYKRLFYDYPMSGKEGQLSHLHVGNVLPHPTFLALNVRKA